jgi:hypothetical protein
MLTEILTAGDDLIPSPHHTLWRWKVPEVSMNTKLPVSADELWKLVGGFNAFPDWHPGIEKSDLDDGGQRRTMSLVGGGTIVETLVNHDDGSKTYSYEIKDSPLPVANYVSTIKVNADGEKSSSIEWSSNFEASGASENEAVKAIQDVYQAGFDNLRKMFGA